MTDKRKLPHVVVENAATTEEYLFPGTPRDSEEQLPERDRQAHADRLLASLDRARGEAVLRKEEVKAWAVPSKKGVHLQFESEPGFELELESLEDRRQGIQLVAVRPASDREDCQLATVFVPDGKLASLEKKIRQYATEESVAGHPRHRKLIDKIIDIRLATLQQAFWTDRQNLLPAPNEPIWWEVWLRSPEEKVLDDFRSVLGQLGVTVGDRSLQFPSTRVLLAYGTLRQFAASVEAVDSIAELRRAKELASLFMKMPRLELRAWVDDLLNRTQGPPEEAPRICLLDKGVNAGHPLLQVAIDPEDLHAVDPAWGVEDHDQAGHGTGMAGLALYGDLLESLAGHDPVVLPAWLESVKILPPPPSSNDPELYGSITEQATHRVEVQQPRALRTHLMAVTTVDGRDRGRPSSWSAAIDKLAYGEDSEPKRLWILSAGNSDPDAWGDHPDHLDTAEIHDPAQAWNAISVGASTDLWQVDEDHFDGWDPIAGPGDLSPSTSTSLSWLRTPWPLKPDVVAEGGNAARSPDGRQIDQPDSLQLLTTYRQPLARLLTPFGDTSGASALVAHMAAEIRRQYPRLWPETIRALIVHSARWTPAMLERYKPSDARGGYEHLVRRCGFGVANLERALWSAGNRLTLIAEESIRPFIRKPGRSDCSLKELQIYDLPWPIEQLRDLGDIEVELRVTLSYFIEPNPSERGYKYRHRYASHGYRFDVRAGVNESLDDFKKRLNKAARDEDEGSPRTGDPTGWHIGTNARHRGSIHSDFWRGPAAELADRQHIAVYPVSGWWKERPYLDRWRRAARYALVVSIHAPEIEVDLYTPVRTQVGIPIEI